MTPQDSTSLSVRINGKGGDRQIIQRDSTLDLGDLIAK